jgi:hypothetical protein
VTEHVADEPDPLSVQVVPGLLNPPLLGLTENVTVPPGVLLVPLSVSVTVAVHELGLLASTGVVQLTVVLVLRWPTVTVVLPVLVLCVVSPAYVAVMVGDPTLVWLYVTEHAAVAPDPVGVQVVLLNVKPLLVLVLQVTEFVPPGVVALVAVSLTVVVQVVFTPSPTVPGEQLTVVVVGSTKRGEAEPLLVPCVESPP